jgi:hypothetical protein
MRVYICKHKGKLILTDLPIHWDGEKDLTVGVPKFMFYLTETLEDSSNKLCEEFGLVRDSNYKMELRMWPEG